MDPLTIFVFSIVGSIAVDALRSPGSFEQYYRWDPEVYRGWTKMYGDGVVWLVPDGYAVWIKSRYLRPISGNIFDSGKLGAVSRAVKEGRKYGNRPVFYAPYGQISKIEPGEVAESIQYAQYNVGPVLTTGDDQLDAWLGDKDLFEQDYPELARKMPRRLKQAVKNRSGDLGQWMASVRDGNHRAFGSVLGGEEKVAIRIYDNDLEYLRLGCERGGKHKLSAGGRALLDKMIEDSGIADWMKHPEYSTALRLKR